MKECVDVHKKLSWLAFLKLIKTRVTSEEGTSIEELLPSDALWT